MINIPLSNKFYHDFKFDLTLPSPAPEAKYVFYRFDKERFTKARLTNLNYMEKSRMYTTVDLGLNLLDLNIRPEIYNGDPEMRMPGNLTEEDEILFGEKKKAFRPLD